MTDFQDPTEPMLEPGQLSEREPPGEELLVGGSDALGDLVFDERHRKDFEGLMFLGRLEDEFEWMGHTFVVRTVTVDELLQASLLTREYEGTLGADRAYLAAIAAAAIETVDGKPLVTPLGRNDNVHAQKFKYIRENWYSWTVDAVYMRFRQLELRVQEILDAMGEASG